MKSTYLLIFCLAIFIAPSFSLANFNDLGTNEKGSDVQPIQNPMSVRYLKKKLRKSSPRLVLTPTIEKNLKKKLVTDPAVKNMYKAIKLNAGKIYEQPLLERKLLGRRLLSVSREMLYRINMLGMVYRIEKDPKVCFCSGIRNRPRWRAERGGFLRTTGAMT